MKNFVGGVIAAVVLSFSGLAFAGDAENAAWIGKCVKELDLEGNTPAVGKKWCECMNYEMSEDETLSILAWVKTKDGQKADEKCNKESGWVEKK